MNKVLMYHSIGRPESGEAGAELYAVSLDNFREQVAYIAEVGATITFDDGLGNNYTDAFPILKEQGLSSYFFIIPPGVGRKGYMKWEQVRKLKNSGMIIGSHGMTHRILTGLSDRELRAELIESKKMIEGNLGAPVEYFSVPRGFLNEKIAQMAKEAGYKAIFTSEPKDANGFKIGRIAVRSDWSLDKFKDILDNGYSLQDRSGDFLKKVAQKALGVRKYDNLRARILNK